MAENDLYKILGVARDASADDIRKAHRKLSRENHPDMKPNDKAALERFKQVQQAYDILGDAEKREQYDRYGTAFPGGGPGGPGPQGWTGQGPGGAQVDINDLFGSGGLDLESLFGGANPFGGGGAKKSRAPRSRPGEDFQLEVTVPFTVAVEGGGHDVQYQHDGQTERLSVKIPAGVSDGAVIRLAGQGGPGVGKGPRGDLLITIRVAPHPYFRREGNNLSVDVPVTFTEAALGGKVDVPTVSEGVFTLTVPPGTASGTKLRLRGKGVVERQSGQRGDLYAVIKIVPPADLSARARSLLEELQTAAPQDPRHGLW